MAASRTKGTSTAIDASMPVVILHGADRFMIAHLSRLLVETLEAAHGEVDQFEFDGDAVEPATVLDELRTCGLIQPHKLVIVDQADRLLAAQGPGAESASLTSGPTPGPTPGRAPGRGVRRTARELFEKYAAAPVDTATLLMRAETWRPGRIDKAVVAAGGAVVKCQPPNARTAGTWCVEQCRAVHRSRLSREAADLLVDRIGPDRARLDLELAKLAAYAGDAEIGPDAVRELVGPSREERAWAIQIALLSGTQAAAGKLRELTTISRQPDQLIIWAMTDLLKKLHAAARLMREGESPGAIASRLQLWGEARDAVLRKARRLEPDRLAQLLRAAVETDMQAKRGIGAIPRSLEALALRIADTVAG